MTWTISQTTLESLFAQLYRFSLRISIILHFFGAHPPKLKNQIKSLISYVINHISKCNFSIKCIKSKGRRLAQLVEQHHMYRGFVLAAAAQGTSPGLGPFVVCHSSSLSSRFLSSLELFYQKSYIKPPKIVLTLIVPIHNKSHLIPLSKSSQSRPNSLTDLFTQIQHFPHEEPLGDSGGRSAASTGLVGLITLKVSTWVTWILS